MIAVMILVVLLACIFTYICGMLVGAAWKERQYADRETERRYMERIEQLETLVIEQRGSPDDWERRFTKEARPHEHVR